MNIQQVIDDLVCTRRAPGMGPVSLRVVRDLQGVISVATDAVGAPLGRWVITNTGSAARISMPDKLAITDLTICGIIDHWEEADDAPAA